MNNYEIKILLLGDCAITVEMGDTISLEVNARVRTLKHLIEAQHVGGIVEMVPTYASLTIHYNPEIIRFDPLVEKVRKIAQEVQISDLIQNEVIEIPIIYGGQYGIDLEECALLQGVTPQELIRMHSQSLYYTYMLGFAPGHPYLVRSEDPFSFKRRQEPRLKIPAGSVVVAENLSNLIPFDQPCGWNIIGHTPVTMFNENNQPPSLINVGDWVKFQAVEEEEYLTIKEAVKQGTYHCKRYPKESHP